MPWRPNTTQDYDDAYCLSYARSCGGCIVTNDRYRDFVEAEARQGGTGARQAAENWRRTHLISFTFIGDEFLPNPEFSFPV